MVFLYLLSPLVYYVTRLRGVFFTDRHYIYFELAVPLLFLTSAFCLSEYVSSRKGRDLGVAMSLLASLVLVLAFSGKSLSAAVREAAATNHIGVPNDPTGSYEKLIRTELPQGFCFQSVAPSDSFSIENMKLVAEWLPVRYNADPVGAKSVYLVRDGNNARVLSVDTAACTGRMIRVARGGSQP
jgi:hypothetical protein